MLNYQRVTWIPSIYPLYVSIYTSTSRIRHGLPTPSQAELSPASKVTLLVIFRELLPWTLARSKVSSLAYGEHSSCPKIAQQSCHRVIPRQSQKVKMIRLCDASGNRPGITQWVIPATCLDRKQI